MTSFAQNGLLLDVQHVTMRFGGIDPMPLPQRDTRFPRRKYPLMSMFH